MIDYPPQLFCNTLLPKAQKEAKQSSALNQRRDDGTATESDRQHVPSSRRADGKEAATNSAFDRGYKRQWQQQYQFRPARSTSVAWCALDEESGSNEMLCDDDDDSDNEADSRGLWPH